MTIYEKLEKERDWWRDLFRGELQARYLSSDRVDKMMDNLEIQKNKELGIERKTGESVKTESNGDGASGREADIDSMEKSKKDLPQFLAEGEIQSTKGV